MKYGELNLGQIEAIVNRLGGMDGVHKLLSDKLIIKEAEYQGQTFKMLVDYNKTLAEMIQAGNYDWVDSDITSDHFPIKGSGQKEKEITLFHFNRVISSDDAIAEMEKAGYRPGLIEELLVLGAEHKELQGQFPIVALGSVWRHPHGGRRVSYLDWGGRDRRLRLSLFGYDWSKRYRFVAVRNAS